MYSRLFMSIIMDLDIEYEINKVAKIINDDTFDKSLCTTQLYFLSTKQNYLLNITKITMKYPEIETYLRDLLIKFSINEVEPLNNIPIVDCIFSSPVMFHMMISTDNISLNALEIIIKYGINVNHTDIYGNTLLHYLFHYNFKSSVHIINILNLFIKYSVDLNIINNYSYTVLDKITYCWNINEELNIYITILLDNGAKINKPCQNNNDILNFIESYCYDNIKPAIKK